MSHDGSLLAGLDLLPQFWQATTWGTVALEAMAGSSCSSMPGCRGTDTDSQVPNSCSAVLAQLGLACMPSGAILPGVPLGRGDHARPGHARQCMQLPVTGPAVPPAPAAPAPFYLELGC